MTLSLDDHNQVVGAAIWPGSLQMAALLEKLMLVQIVSSACELVLYSRCLLHVVGC